MQGREPHSVGDVMTLACYGKTAEQFAEDPEGIVLRQETAAIKRDEAAAQREADRLGKPGPRPWVAQLAAAKAERLAREQAERETPASVADVKKVKQLLGERVQQIKTGVLAITG